MKQHFHKKEPLLLEQARPGQPKSKKEISNAIQSLVKRRQAHEARIDQLVGHRYTSRDATQESLKNGSGSEFSQLLEQLDNNEAIEINCAQGSVGAFGSHVNLLATVSLKTQYFLAQKVEKKQLGQFYPSLLERYADCNFSRAMISEPKSKKLPTALKQAIDYLKDEQISQELFTQLKDINEKSIQYHGTRFHLGKYEQIHLSKNALLEQQTCLIYETTSEEKVIEIGWVLLHRLLSQTHQHSFPHIIHTLFSYPIRTFRIRESLQLIEFSELLKEMAKLQEDRPKEEQSPLKIFGIEEKNGYAYEIENISKSKSIKNYTPILNRFKQLVVIHQEELPVKHIPLSCLQNHFVVVSIITKAKGDYFISVGSANISKQFRVYILNYQGRIVSSQLVSNGEFVYCRLQEEQYEVYINPIRQDQSGFKDMEASYELVSEIQENFNLWVQGKEIYSKFGEMGLEIRLKEDYNNYTQKIVEQYMQSKSELEKSTYPQHTELVVRREIISGLHLVRDTFLCERKFTLTVKYSGTPMLTDHLFQQTQVTVSAGGSVVLYEQAQIESIVLQGRPQREEVEFSVQETYV